MKKEKEVEFYGVRLVVNQDVLTPRQETEFLVERVIKYLNVILSQAKDLKDSSSSIQNDRKFRILDIGTGSGAIAIALAKTFPNANVTASDISNEARKLAKKNADINKTNIEFLYSDLFENISGKFDIIIANLPYVKIADPDLDPTVLKSDPGVALYGGSDGLDAIRKFLQEAPRYLSDSGAVFMEIGFDQGDKIKKMGAKYFPKKSVIIDKDYAGLDRYCIIK